MTADKNEIWSDKRMLNQYKGLLSKCKPDMSNEEFGMLKKAMNLALDACQGKPVKLGDHTIFHALGVASIIAGEIGLGATSIIASLLFDFYLNGCLNKEDLEPHIDSNILQIIEGVDKISRIDTHKSNDQGENLRNLLLTLSSDIRVILVKLADSLYYMRNLEHLDRVEQLTISTETFHIYAPLAHRMGLYNIKSELEDLYLKYTDIKAYKEIVEKLQETKVSRDKFITGFIAPLQKQLKEERFDFEIKGRTKSVYSIWSKMKQQQIDFEEVYDLFAIRIILRSDTKFEKSDCWKVYSLVTDHYQPNPNRLRDWISVPQVQWL